MDFGVARGVAREFVHIEELARIAWLARIERG
jgi:hypothetical protein